MLKIKSHEVFIQVSILRTTKCITPNTTDAEAKGSKSHNHGDAVPSRSPDKGIFVPKEHCKEADQSAKSHLHVVLNAIQSHLGGNDIHDLVGEHHDGKPQQVEQRQGGKGH